MKILWAVPVILVLDQSSKIVVQNTMVRRESIPVLGDYFRLTYIHNPGAAFGLDLGSSLLHTLISIAALLFVGWLFFTTPRESRCLRLGLSMVVGGALGNIIDRLYLGAVVDFFDVGFGALRWPVFNVADSFVTGGIFLLAIGYLVQREKDKTSPGRRRPGDQVLEG